MPHTFRLPAPVNASRTVYAAAAGDIADPRSADPQVTSYAYKTGRLLDDLIGLHPDFTPPDGVARKGVSIMPLGDLVYPHGTTAQFANNYRPYWGDGSNVPTSDSWNYGNKKPHTWPVIGNHEGYNDTQGNVTPKLGDLAEYAPYDDEYGAKSQGMSTDPDVYQGFYPGRGNPGGRYYARDLVAPDGKSYWMLICYNSDKGEGGGPVSTYTRQLTWYSNMLANAAATGATLPHARADGSKVSRHTGFAQHLLICAHHPLMAFNRKLQNGVPTGSNGEGEQSEYWVRAQDHPGIKVMMAGHYHYYARTEYVRWRSVGASVGDATSSIAANVNNGIVLILNGIGGTNSRNQVGDLGAHNDHLQKAISQDYVISHLMLEPHRMVGEAVAIDDATFGTQYDPPFTLSYGTAPPPVTPGITSFSPVSGPAGTSVDIVGSGFTGATNVIFDGGLP